MHVLLVGPVSTPKKSKNKKFFKKNKRKKTQQLRKERVLQQLEELQHLLLATSDLELKRAYIKHIRALTEKVQLPLPRSIKHTFCRRCSEPFTLEPIKTFTVRIRSKPEPMILNTCLSCGYIRRKSYGRGEKNKQKSQQSQE